MSPIRIDRVEDGLIYFKEGHITLEQASKGITEVILEALPKISKEDFQKIWDAAQLKILADNNLLHEYDLGYMENEVKSSYDYYNQFIGG
jgi:hypothetical protein